jgi:hypothetical protein
MSGTPAISSPLASEMRIRPASGKPSTVHATNRTAVGAPFWSANTATAAAMIATMM